MLDEGDNLLGKDPCTEKEVQTTVEWISISFAFGQQESLVRKLSGTAV